MMKRIMLFISMAAMFAACDPIEYDTFANITGTVVDADEQTPVVGATVSLSPSGKSTSTDNNGYFQFMDLDAETYTVQIQKTGYQPNRRTITAAGGSTENIIIPLQKQ